MVESARLESVCGRKITVSSNLTPTALEKAWVLRLFGAPADEAGNLALSVYLELRRETKFIQLDQLD